MIAGSVTAHGGGVVTPGFFGPHSPARAGGKLIIIVVDNTNREQFIIAPLLPDCVSTSRVARPDTIIQWRGMRRERGGITVEEGRDGEWEKWGLMRFWWCLSRRGSFKHDHLTGSLVWISPSSTPPITHLWLLPLRRGGEPSASAATTVPHPRYLKCNCKKQITVHETDSGSLQRCDFSHWRYY